jgi:hypothetical protein
VGARVRGVREPLLHEKRAAGNRREQLPCPFLVLPHFAEQWLTTPVHAGSRRWTSDVLPWTCSGLPRIEHCLEQMVEIA